MGSKFFLLAFLVLAIQLTISGSNDENIHTAIEEEEFQEPAINTSPADFEAEVLTVSDSTATIGW